MTLRPIPFDRSFRGSYSHYRDITPFSGGMPTCHDLYDTVSNMRPTGHFFFGWRGVVKHWGITAKTSLLVAAFPGTALALVLDGVSDGSTRRLSL
jgi:hypothetical protein